MRQRKFSVEKANSSRHGALMPLLPLGTLGAALASLRLCLVVGTAPRSLRCSCPPKDPWILTGSMQCSHPGRKKNSHPSPHSAQTHSAHTSPPSSRHFTGHSLLTSSRTLKSTCVSQSAKHRCSVFLDYFNQYLLRVLCLWKGKSPQSWVFNLCIFFFRNVIRYFQVNKQLN